MTTMTLEAIEKRMLEGEIPPARLGELRIILGALYSQEMNKLEKIRAIKPSVWNEMRKDHKSDKATDREWEGSELGIAELHHSFQIKKMEKLMSALKMQWDIVNTELRNIT